MLMIFVLNTGFTIMFLGDKTVYLLVLCMLNQYVGVYYSLMWIISDIS